MRLFISFLISFFVIVSAASMFQSPRGLAFAQVADNATKDNATNDNITSDNFTDNNTLIDNETKKKLMELFATAHDNYSCKYSNDIVLFPEGTRLANCVIEAVAGKYRYPYTCENVSEIKTLNCKDTQISSLDGLQQLVNLENLVFNRAGTSISDLSPIRNLKKLKNISIPNSNISEIGWIVFLDNLSTLDLVGNSVTDLKFIPLLQNLDRLFLDYQAPRYITDVTALGKLRNLKILSLQGNKISDVAPLAKLTALNNLILRDNRISELSPLAGLKSLTSLDFSINMVSNIEVLDNFTKLSEVAGNNNRIVSLRGLDNLSNLRKIEFMMNKISDVSPVARKSKIISIILDYNRISNLKPIQDIMFYTSLAELGLAYNCIDKDNFSKFFYLDKIKILRRANQSPPAACTGNYDRGEYPDDNFVVNRDLVGAKDILSKEGITVPKYEQTQGQAIGCSVGFGKNYDVTLILSLVAVFILFLKRIRKGDC